MSCYIEDEVDYEIFQLTEENCNESTDELNVILNSSSQDPLSDITPNNNVASKEAESVSQESKCRSNAPAIAKVHDVEAEAKKGEAKNTVDKKVDIKKNEVVKKGEVKNNVHYYQQQSGYTIASRIYATPHFKGQQEHNDSKYANGTYVDRKARDEVLDKQRREAAESLRRRLANRQQEGGMKRKHTDGPNSETKRLHTDAPTNVQKRGNPELNESKRPAAQSNHVNPIPPNRGFSIRGAAAKASLQDRPRDVRKEEGRSPKAPSKPPVTTRLQRREQASPIAKKVVNGKSSELVISNLNENTTFSDIKKLVDEINTVAKITYQNGEPTSTLVFGSIDTAVTFRRKYNRSKMGDSDVKIAFKK